MAIKLPSAFLNGIVTLYDLWTADVLFVSVTLLPKLCEIETFIKPLGIFFTPLVVSRHNETLYSVKEDLSYIFFDEEYYFLGIPDNLKKGANGIRIERASSQMDTIINNLDRVIEDINKFITPH